ncbi:hypothetical protein [Streptomyces sp. NPDC056527]|uniref:hypothetical protein n=1 Tax=Streptomyces sp. NPDC056527 TaxID=3345853 RepID=UPI0036B4B3A3
MRTLVEEAVAQTLHRAGGETVRLYVAACAERMVPLVLGLRADGAGRDTDRDFYVECVRDLWCADRPLADACERVRVLEQFPELQPRDEGISGAADTYAFFSALVLRHALVANHSGNVRAAMSCGHAALTAMGMLDQNTGGAVFGDEEKRLQLLSVSGEVAGLWERSVAAGRERLRAVLSRTALDSGRRHGLSNPGGTPHSGTRGDRRH